jgi:hypothetical protein
MTTNDNTSFGTLNENRAAQNTEKKQENVNWKTVTIGGATGVFLGAAAMYAADAFAGNNSEAATDGTETVEGTDILLAEVHRLLLSVGLHFDAEHLTAFTTHHLADSTADGRGKLHFRILFVDKQRIPGFDFVTFVDYDLRSDSFEIVRHQSILAVRFQLDLFLLSPSLQVDVQAFS